MLGLSKSLRSFVLLYWTQHWANYFPEICDCSDWSETHTVCAIGHELSDNGFMCRVCMRWSLKGYLPYFRKERKETCCIQQPSSLLDICTQICSPSILTEVSSHSDGVKKVFRSLAKQNSWCSVFTLRWGDYTPHMLEVISFKPARCWFLICRGQNQTNVFSYTWLVQRCFYHTFNLHQTMQL